MQYIGRFTFSQKKEIDNKISDLSEEDKEKFYTLYEKYKKSKAKALYLHTALPRLILQNFYIGLDRAPKVTTALAIGFFLLLYVFAIFMEISRALILIIALAGALLYFLIILIRLVYKYIFFGFIGIKVDKVLEEVDNINYSKKNEILNFILED